MAILCICAYTILTLLSSHGHSACLSLSISLDTAWAKEVPFGKSSAISAIRNVSRRAGDRFVSISNRAANHDGVLLRVQLKWFIEADCLFEPFMMIVFLTVSMFCLIVSNKLWL